MTEYEVKICTINKEDIVDRLKKAGGTLQKPLFTQKIAAFHLPQGNKINDGWLRVRDEGDHITMSLKIVDGPKIEDQKEIAFGVKDFKETCQFLELIGARQKSTQEKKREIWHLDDCEIVIDEWPFLEPYIEIEGPSEAAVYAMVEKLGFTREDTDVCSVSKLYKQKYNVDPSVVNNQTPLLVFDMKNPFI